MMRFLSYKTVLLLFSTLLILLSISACDYGKSEDTAKAGSKDSSSFDGNNSDGDDDASHAEASAKADDDDDNDNDDNDNDNDDNDDNDDLVYCDDDDTPGPFEPDPHPEYIDGGNLNYSNPSIAARPDGSIVVATINGSRAVLLTYQNGQVQTEQIAPYARDIDMAMDEDGYLYLVYDDVYKYALIYTTDAYGSWDACRNNLGFGRNPAITVDSNSDVHVIYKIPNASLIYQYTDSGLWHSEVVTGTDSHSDRADIAIGPDGEPRIVYEQQNYLVLPPLIEEMLVDAQLYFSLRSAGTWTKSRIYSLAFLGWTLRGSVGVDSAGYAHIGYLDMNPYPQAQFRLTYATDSSGNWTRQIVDQTGDSHLQLILDALDAPVIAYNGDSGGGSVKLADKTTGAWNLNIAGQPGNDLEHICITQDDQGVNHIAYTWFYYNRYDSKLAYLNDAAGWVEATLQEMGARGAVHSMARASNGALYMAYGDYRPGWHGMDDLVVANNSSGSWNTEIVAPWLPYISGAMEMAIDSNDAVHIALFDSYQDEMYYITNAGGSWIDETLGYVSVQSSPEIDITTDAQNYVHIAYLDKNSHLSYATNHTGTWVSQTICTDSYCGRSPQIVVDDNDNVFISHLFNMQSDIALSTNFSGTWTTQSLVSGHPGFLAKDSNGYFHIAATNNLSELIYGNNTSGQWIFETVSGYNAPYSLAIDETGAAHILLTLNNDYFYISNETGTWVEKRVDSRNDVGLAASLFLDDAGNALAAYPDFDSLWLATFPR